MPTPLSRSRSTTSAPAPRAERAEPPRAAGAPSGARRAGHATSSSFERVPLSRVRPDAALESSLARAGVRERSRDRIAAQLGALPEAERARERALLDRALASPNAERAAETWSGLERLRTSSRTARDRLTPEIREALVRGVAEPRTGDDLGSEGVLGRSQALRAADTLVRMPRARYDETRDLLSRAGTGHRVSPSADPQAERALLLDAVAARSDSLRGRGRAADASMTELRDFATDVRGLGRDELIRTTSAADLSRRDDVRRGIDGSVGRADDDGLTQRFTDSCAPTTAQLARAELDPVYARRLHREGLVSGSGAGAAADEERRVLTARGGSARSRDAQDAIGRASAAATAAGLSEPERARLGRYLRGERLSTDDLMGVAIDLERMRSRSPSAPSAEEVRLIRGDHARGAGMELSPALGAIARGVAHGRYVERDHARGLSSAAVGDLSRRLEAGHDVAIRVSDARGRGGHFMLITNTRATESGAREFLISDPWSGRSGWVSQSALTTPGTTEFNSRFGLSWDRVTTTYSPPE